MINYIKVFEKLGLKFHEQKSQQKYISVCPFNKKEMFVNKDSGFWDSGNPVFKGDFNKFINLFFKKCKENTKITDLSPLSFYKLLPCVAFEGLAYNKLNSRYLYPIKNYVGNIRSFCILEQSEQALCLFDNDYIIGLESVHKKNIIVCDGIFNMLALKWLIASVQADYEVICITDWIDHHPSKLKLLRNKNVTVILSHQPGNKIQKTKNNVYRVLKKHAGSFKRIYWPDLIPKDYGALDLILQIGKAPVYTKENLEKTYMKMINLCRS